MQEVLLTVVFCAAGSPSLALAAPTDPLLAPDQARIVPVLGGVPMLVVAGSLGITQIMGGDVGIPSQQVSNDGPKRLIEVAIANGIDLTTDNGSVLAVWTDRRDKTTRILDRGEDAGLNNLFGFGEPRREPERTKRPKWQVGRNEISVSEITLQGQAEATTSIGGFDVPTGSRRSTGYGGQPDDPSK